MPASVETRDMTLGELVMFGNSNSYNVRGSVLRVIRNRFSFFTLALQLEYSSRSGDFEEAWG